MGKINMIILNYNDCPTTLSLVDEVRDYEYLDSVVVVDSHSSDGSWKHLQPFNGSGKVHAIRMKQSGGYGLGNQEGTDYTVDRLGAEYMIIADPDIHATQRYVCRIKGALDRTRGAVAASARVEDPQGGELFSYWALLPLWKDLLDTGLVTRYLLKAVFNTPSHRLAHMGDEDCRLADAIPGSFFMLETGVLTPGGIKEVFDKHIFSCYEEKVLEQKFRKMGLKTVLVTDESYAHAYSASIDKSFRRIVGKQRLPHRSKPYYYRGYLGVGPTGMAAARAVLGIVPVEVWFLTAVYEIWRQGGMRRQILKRRAARRRALRHSAACRKDKITYERTGK